jgi:probable rRNA maturation factor
MPVRIENLQTKLKVSPAWMRTICQKTFQIENIPRADLTVLLVSRQRMQAMNRKHLQHNYATDVLTFDLSDEGDEGLVGDIVISTDAALLNARRFDTQARYEVALYVVHGILHLWGYDDQTAPQRQEMRAAEQRILSKVQI